MNNQSIWEPVFKPLVISLTLGLAPFVPEPHVVGKVKWLIGGGAGMKAMDIFDTFLHGTPWVWLGFSLLMVLKDIATSAKK